MPARIAPRLLATSLLIGSASTALPAAAGPAEQAAAEAHARVIAYWTPERRAAAQPRDLRIDPRGLAYQRQADGTLVPYGHSVAALGPSGQSPQAKPIGGTSDTTPPTIDDTSMDPSAGETVGGSATFSLVATDNAGGTGVRSVTVYVGKTSSTMQSFPAQAGANNTWSVSLQGLSDGDQWQWWAVAKDGGAKGGNTDTSATVGFSVDTASGGGGGGGGSVITSAEWNHEPVLRQASGRIYFEMPSNSRRTRWAGYVCSGTVVADGTNGRSIIQTAAHCVYDDAYKAFARNVMFIPDQGNTTGTGTDRNCSNDPIGCWTTAFGVVDSNWTTRTFPNNVAWDYAYYVVHDTGAHQGNASASPALDGSVPPQSLNFGPPAVDTNDAADYTHATGYSYSDDPNFMYCAEDMTTESAVNWWLPSCELSGGSSGGAWVQPRSGPVISVNSWGYTTSPGMAGPKLNGTSACNIFASAKSASFAVPAGDGNAGYAITASSCP